MTAPSAAASRFDCHRHAATERENRQAGYDKSRIDQQRIDECETDCITYDSQFSQGILGNVEFEESTNLRFEFSGFSPLSLGTWLLLVLVPTSVLWSLESAIHQSGVAHAAPIGSNPNLSWAWLFSGWVKIWHGEPEVGIERVTRALRLSPHDPHRFSMQSAMACAHLFAGRYAEALSWAESAMREQSNTLIASCIAAAGAALAGQQCQAIKAMSRVRQLDPKSLANLKDLSRSRVLRTLQNGPRGCGGPGCRIEPSQISTCIIS